MAGVVPIYSDFYGLVPVPLVLPDHHNRTVRGRGDEHLITIPADFPGLEPLVQSTLPFAPWKRDADNSASIGGLTFLKLTILSLNFKSVPEAVKQLNPTQNTPLPLVALHHLKLVFDKGMPCWGGRHVGSLMVHHHVLVQYAM